jgi:hypothetical protein
LTSVSLVPTLPLVIVGPVSVRAVRVDGGSLRISDVSVMLETRVPMLVVHQWLVTDSCCLSVVAPTHFIRVRMFRQSIRVLLVDSLLAAEEAEKSLPSAAIAGSVVVGRARAKARLLTAVAYENDFNERR